MRKMRWSVVAVSVGLLSWSAVAQDTLNIDFESPTYSVGDIVGQDDWVLITGGGGTATIVSSDNGPGGSGSQCLELGDELGNIKIEKMFADLVGTLPKLVTYRIDLRVVSGSDMYYCKPYIPGGLCGYWHTNWAQWTGAYNPDGTNWQWSYGTTGWDQYVWHTHTWRMLYSDHDGGKGQLLSYQLDNQPAEIRYAAQQCYIRNNQSTVLDLINVEFYNQGDTDPDRVRLDNVVITTEELPSAIPVADAGPDLSGDPGQYYTLDGSGSTDDVGIVRYRWATGDHWDAILYDGSDPAPAVVMPGGTYTVMLEVFDGDGLRDTDFMECSFEYEPTDTVVIDFEPETYTTGTLQGQDGWVEAESNGTATVVAVDNGPGLPGSQCLELDNNGFTSGDLRLQRGMADVAEHGGPLVTFQYDYKSVSTDRVTQFDPQVPGMNIGHWHQNWAQWRGARRADGTDWGTWGTSYSGWGEWHTFKWTVVYSDHDGGVGQLLTYEFDGVPRTWYASECGYMRNDASNIVDQISMLFGPQYDGYNDTFLVDNIVVMGAPLPSAIPIADAGPDVTQDPGSWDGVVLQGGGSTDDGEVSRYRWTIGWGGALVYDGPEAEPVVELPVGVNELVLEVFDDTGLRDTDTAVYTIGERPAILDQVAGPWAILHGDIYGTSASDAVPFDLGSGEIEVVNEVYVNGPWSGLPLEGNGSVVFDRLGNLYFQAWNEFLESYSPTLSRRWRGHDGGAEVHLGDNGIENHSTIAGIRYIYVVGAGRNDHGGQPAVYAFEKSTGQLVWETGLTGEDWSGHAGFPKVTLYNDKLYIVGENDLEWLKIHQVDATTGNHDWASNCYVEMQYMELNNSGGVAFVPDAYGPGLHGLLFNQISAAGAGGDDGYADMVAIEIDPASGATVVWGPGQNIDGPGLERSCPIYSATTNRIYTPSFEGDSWQHSFYAWQSSATPSPLVATHTTGQDVGHGYRRAFALDFDGQTVHATGEWDTLRSYTDNEDGTFDYVYREFGGFYESAWGFEGEGALLRDQSSGDSIFLTSTASNADPNEVYRVPSKVVAINVSAPVDPNDPICEFVAEWFCQEWDPDAENFDLKAPMAGPIPGPDGTFYVFQDNPTHWDLHRIVRLRFRPTEPVCSGDVDGDGDTDLNDLAALLSAYGSFEGDPNYNPAADFDEDGDVDLTDLAFLLSDYGCTP